MLLRLFLLFTLLPIADLALLIWIGSKTSLLFAIGLAIGTGIVGAWLARQQGWRALRRVQQDMAAGRVPTESLLDGLLILVAGVLLVAPGVITDVLGIVLLIPVSRRLVRRLIFRQWMRRVTAFSGAAGRGQPSFDRDGVIDVRVIERPASAEKPRQ